MCWHRNAIVIVVVFVVAAVVVNYQQRCFRRAALTRRVGGRELVVRKFVEQLFGMVGRRVGRTDATIVAAAGRQVLELDDAMEAKKLFPELDKLDGLCDVEANKLSFQVFSEDYSRRGQ